MEVFMPQWFCSGKFEKELTSERVLKCAKNMTVFGGSDVTLCVWQAGKIQLLTWYGFCSCKKRQAVLSRQSWFCCRTNAFRFCSCCCCLFVLFVCCCCCFWVVVCFLMVVVFLCCHCFSSAKSGQTLSCKIYICSSKSVLFYGHFASTTICSCSSEILPATVDATSPPLFPYKPATVSRTARTQPLRYCDDGGSLGEWSSWRRWWGWWRLVWARG